MPRCLDRERAAEYLQISTDSIDRLVHAGISAEWVQESHRDDQEDRDAGGESFHSSLLAHFTRVLG